MTKLVFDSNYISCLLKTISCGYESNLRFFLIKVFKILITL